MTNIKKFAVLSHTLPPSVSGQAIMLYRFLEPLSKKSYCLISRENYNVPDQLENASKKLSGNYYHLKIIAHTGDKRRIKLFEYLKISLDIIWRARQINKIIRQEQVKILIICSGDFSDMVSGYLASCWQRIKLVPYMFDWFGYQWTGLFSYFSKFIESLVVRYASDIIVPNEFLQKEYFQQYGKKGTIIRNPCFLPNLRNLDKNPKIFKKKDINIVYTGAIYRAHYDAFYNLINALKLIKHWPIKLHIYTAQPKAEIRKEKILSKNVIIHPHINQAEINNVQRQADILFLPLAFRSPIPEIIKTSAPGKLGEYLAVGKPILAHVPKDSFVSWYLRKNKCGIVVDKLDPKMLAKAIIKIIKDKKLPLKLAKNAWHRAEKDFAVENVRKKFTNLLNTLSRIK